MINPMQQVVIATRSRSSDAVITALQDAGVLHLKPITGGPLNTGSLTEGDAQSRREDERLLARADSTIAELGSYRPAPTPLPDSGQWAAIVEGAAQPVSVLARNRQELQADADVERAYGDAVRALARMAGPLDRSRRLSLLPFLLQPSDDVAELDAALRETLPERYALATETVGQNRVGLVVTLARERDVARAALGKVRLGELRLPGRFDGLPLGDASAEMDRIKRDGAARQGQLNAERDALAKQHGPALYAVRDALKDRVAVHDVRAVSARGKYSLVMQGFVPVDRVPALNAALGSFGDAVSYELHPVDELHDDTVPVQLKNSDYVSRFSVVMGLLSLPKYGTFDPTWVIAVFFPLFFGIIIADIGYGLLFLWFGMWLLGKARRNEGWDLSFFGAFVPPATLSNLGYVVNVMAAWCIGWGFLTGEMFGTLLEHLHFFYINPELLNNLWGWTGITYVEEAGITHRGLVPILFPRLETAYFSNVALVFSLLFGILQVLWAWGIRVQQGLKHHDSAHVWEGLALFGSTVALICMAFATRAGKDFGQFTNFSSPLVLLMYAGFALFVVGWIIVIKQFPLLPIELMSQGAAVLSYARIFAVGLVSAILARLCTDLGWSLYENIGVLGILLGLLVGVILHFFVLALTLIGHIVQPIRLQMVEFLNPTGFNNDTSPAYNPLRRLSPSTESSAGQVK
ncbi:V-type ATP synthase subunit I [Deinococcus radiopugnans]|uniref:V-type ATP synthase subunit I n=1 Tax=Deinococcus radiopugnans ATCC 19172 TaxID=585398 RepID=A0A5C4Y3X0_9DEIO|nr:V-type ATP synthase subunit I [Deinococcus radiopugnans]MBB6017228.1 V/A-type H+-transporting ATPase subunit I [Deinococcus radiopugnans ATCC 19172]TNM70542.1 V-type ATP synthase subunit I [Deinococcus radiopugnans ATCC 19172]